MDYSGRTEWKYDVFLSFRGDDTRRGFTDHLYAALNRKGFKVFMDHQNLERGKEISSELLKAIEKSRISIIIFSKNYAGSPWCLDELAKISDCIGEDKRYLVVPVFYDVSPSDVRRQTGCFEKAFEKHEIENQDKVGKWREVLFNIANLSGWHLHDRLESEFIQDIVKYISTVSSRPPSINLKDLVGINSRLDKLMMHIREGCNDVRMIGICGIGGMGKTTIARVMYELISHEFEGSSFLANVREVSEKNGLISLQKQLLSDVLMETDCKICNVFDGISEIKSRLQHKKVLIVIDDVVHLNQLNNLAGHHDWFGLGSRIIITTRDKHLLTIHGVDVVYKCEELNRDEALKLFRLKAFKCQPSKDCEELCELFVNYAHGLPLAISVLGSFLFGRTIDEWKSALNRLYKNPEKEILDVLQISFDGLQEIEKKIFLDIACFFNGKDVDYVTRILNECYLDTRIGLRVLIDKALVTILDNKLRMHDLLQEMGRQIVKRESLQEPGKRSRLWDEADVYHVLTKNTGTEAVEGIILNFCEKEVHLNAKAFSKMVNLRLLIVPNVKLPQGLEYLSNELRLLKWHGYPLKSLPSNLQLDKIVELRTCCSRIEQLWKGIKSFHQLKSINLSHSKNLMRTPDLTGVPNLEELILEGCIRLRVIHPSLAVHKKLKILNLKGCTSLATFPSKIDMESLKKLILSGCSRLNKFSEIVGNMECLSELLLDGTGIRELSSSVEGLKSLVLLNLKDCKNLKRLPSNLNCLKSLKTLNLFGCSNLENLPENLGHVESLEQLDVSGTAIRQPISSIFLMKNLKELSFCGCKGTPSKSWYSHFPLTLMQRSSYSEDLMLPSLSGLCSLTKLDLSDCNLQDGALPSDFGCLLSLQELYLSKNNFVSLPASINCLSKLQYLNLESCRRLQSLPELPSNINTIRLDACDSLETLSVALRSFNSKWLVISCMNCLKLLGCKSMVSLMMESYLKTMSTAIIEFSVVVPGSWTPEWFSYKSEGSTIKIDRPPHMHNGGKLVGFAICSVFVVHKHPPAPSDVFGTHKLFCYLKADDELSSTSHFTHFEEKFGQGVSDHLWLLYLSCHDYFDVEWKNDYKSIEFSFASQWGPGLEVKRCGVHPLYEHEVEEFHQTMNQSGISNFGNVNEKHQEIFESTSTTTKGSQADYDREESTGAVYYYEGPKAKRFKRT